VAPPVLDPAHVGLREFTADGDHVAGTLLMQGQRLAAEPYDVSKDGDSICIQARNRFEWEVVAELNIWGLREGASATWEKVSGDCIRVSIWFKYRIHGGPDRDGLLQINFTDQGPYHDRYRLYKVAGVGLYGYDGWFGGALQDRVKEVLRDGVAVHAMAGAGHAGPFATGGNHGHLPTGAPQGDPAPPQAPAPAETAGLASVATQVRPDTVSVDAYFADLARHQREQA
jgi:hypothetical protein